MQVQVQVQPQTRGKGWWLDPPRRGGDSAPPCGRTEGVEQEAVEEGVVEAHPKKLTATHEGVSIDAGRKIARTHLPRSIDHPMRGSSSLLLRRGYVEICNVRQRRRAITRCGHGKDKRTKHQEVGRDPHRRETASVLLRT